MPFDLDAVASEGEPFEFTFGGDTYTLSSSLDLRVVGSLTKGEVDDALRRLLGDEQYARMQASPAVFTKERFEALLNAYMAHTGTDMGEASASTGS